MQIKEKLLEAAARVYAETGYRGATTRRIAQEAGVNEVTLFRQFGSKDSLIQAAIACAGQRAEFPSLPEDPEDPVSELTEWCKSRLQHLSATRSLIRTVMGELEEHPEIIEHASRCPAMSSRQLSAYVTRLCDRGIARATFSPPAASALLMGALFADALSRDVMPQMYPHSPDDTVAQYVRLFLRGIGVEVAERGG